jgi:hypothetical protein
MNVNVVIKLVLIDQFLYINLLVIYISNQDIL